MQLAPLRLGDVKQRLQEAVEWSERHPVGLGVVSSLKLSSLKQFTTRTKLQYFVLLLSTRLCAFAPFFTLSFSFLVFFPSTFHKLSINHQLSVNFPSTSQLRKWKEAPLQPGGYGAHGGQAPQGHLTVRPPRVLQDDASARRGVRVGGGRYKCESG
jgi:hypothetical protein